MADENQPIRRILMEQALSNGHEMVRLSTSLATALPIVADLPGVTPDVTRKALMLLITRKADMPEPERMPEQWTPELVAGLAVGISTVMNRATDLAVEEEDESPGILAD